MSYFKTAIRNRGTFTADHRRLVFDSSRWHNFLYKLRNGAVRESVDGLHDPMRTDDTLAATGDAPTDTARAEEVESLADAIGNELFSRLYGNPERMAQASAPPWMERVHDTLDQLPEFDTLRKQVVNDPDFSALACNSMLRALAPRLPDLIKQVQEEEQQQQQEQDGDGNGDGNGNGDGSNPGNAPGQGNQPGSGQGGGGKGPSAQDALRAAMRAACNQAQDNTGNTKDALTGIAPGLDGTPPNELQQTTDRLDLINAITANPRFQEIARKAGRLRRISGRAELRKSKDARDEVVDIEMGADIDRLLAVELMMLADPDLELLQMAKLAERRCVQYRLEGTEPQGRGPLIFLRDVSGSMGGEPHEWGAAINVALIAQAWRAKRAFTSANFDYNAHHGRRLDRSGYYAVNMETGKPTNRIASGSLAPGAMALQCVADGCGGGTSFNAPVRFALKAGLHEPRADFVFLTDGDAYVSDDTLTALQAAKANGLRVYAFCVNGGSVSGPLQAIADEMIDLDREDNIARAAGRALGGALKP